MEPTRTPNAEQNKATKKQPQKHTAKKTCDHKQKTNKKERSTGCRQETDKTRKRIKSTSAPAQSADRHTSTRAVRICVTSGWLLTCTPAQAGSWWRTLLRKLVVTDLPMSEHVTVCFICFLSWFTNWCKSFVTCQSRSGRPVQRTQRRGLTLSNLTNTTTLNKLHAAWHRYPSLSLVAWFAERSSVSWCCLACSLLASFPCSVRPLGLSSGAFWSSQCSAGPLCGYLVVFAMARLSRLGTFLHHSSWQRTYCVCCFGAPSSCTELFTLVWSRFLLRTPLHAPLSLASAASSLLSLLPSRAPSLLLLLASASACSVLQHSNTIGSARKSEKTPLSRRVSQPDSLWSAKGNNPCAQSLLRQERTVMGVCVWCWVRQSLVVLVTLVSWQQHSYQTNNKTDKKQGRPFFGRRRLPFGGRTWDSRVDQQGFEPPPAVCQRWQDKKHNKKQDKKQGRRDQKHQTKQNQQTQQKAKAKGNKQQIKTHKGSETGKGSQRTKRDEGTWQCMFWWRVCCYGKRSLDIRWAAEHAWSCLRRFPLLTWHSSHVHPETLLMYLWLLTDGHLPGPVWPHCRCHWAAPRNGEGRDDTWPPTSSFSCYSWRFMVPALALYMGTWTSTCERTLRGWVRR